VILYQNADSIMEYVQDEAGIDETDQAIERSAAVATSLISYAEVRSALARARAARRFRSLSQYRRSVAAFNDRWGSFYRLNLNESLVQQAGGLAEKHALKGADSLHLAQALALASRLDESIEFSTWDKRLAAAAEAEGLSLAHEVTN
jgi:predicted nucleic acid-binding protein